MQSESESVKQRVTDLEEENNKLKEQIKDLEEENNKLKDTIEDLEQEVSIAKSQTGNLAKKFIDLQDEVEELMKRLSSDVDVVLESQLSDLERALIYGIDILTNSNKKSVERAVLVADNFDNLSSRTFSKPFVHISDIQDFIKMKEEKNTVQWITAKRVAERIIELSDEKFYFKYENHESKKTVLVKDESKDWYESEEQLLN